MMPYPDRQAPMPIEYECPTRATCDGFGVPYGLSRVLKLEASNHTVYQYVQILSWMMEL